MNMPASASSPAPSAVILTGLPSTSKSIHAQHSRSRSTSWVNSSAAPAVLELRHDQRARDRSRLRHRRLQAAAGRDYSPVHRIAGAFTWPFQAPVSTWLGGAAAVLLVPIAFIPLLGYAVAATRATGPPPSWRLSMRLLSDGFWLSIAVAVTWLPFAVVLFVLSKVIGGIALVVAFFALALPWGLVALILLPHATASFATSGRPRDLFDPRSSVRGVQRDFATWNVVVAAIVTAWAIGLASIGLLCVGIVPGVFYAILVSANATAALARPDPDRTAR